MQTRPHRRSIPTSLLASFALLGAACQPSVGPRAYELNAETVSRLDDEPEVRAQILGALGMLFGTPENPRYMMLADWADEGFDPNWPKFPVGDQGSGELPEAELERIQADNERRFAKELRLIEQGRYDELGPFRTAPGLQANVQHLLEHRDEFDDLGEELRLTLVEYYPSLRDSAELYRQQCLHCHGNEGGGDGPTASFLNPLPRDYRRGIYKFTAVKDKAMPRRADLFRILADGVAGTAMPSFRRFSDAELHGLGDYVRLLTMRGMTEHLLVAGYEIDEVLTAETITETFLEVFERWRGLDEKFVAFDGEVPAPTPELLRRGKELYNDERTGNCFSCHGASGVGDGASAWTVAEGSSKRVPAYLDDWGHPIVPRNLTLGIYRGGSRPIDVYRRIYAGINGTPMPALGDSKDADGNPLLDAGDMWALVHYVRSLAERPDGIGIDPHPFVRQQARAGGHEGGPAQATH